MNISGKSQRVAFPTDYHAPYHNPYAVRIACKIIHDYKPTILISGGDGLDFYGISFFSKDPSRVKNGLQHEIDSFRKVQQQINDAAGKANKYMLIGNHEDRWRRFLWDNPELYGLRALTIEKVLELDDLDLSMRDNIVIGKCEFRHGDFVSMHSAYTAKKHLENTGYQRSIFHGHTHRLGSYFKTTSNGVVMAHESGCLADIDKADYVKGITNWQNGLVLVNIVHGTPFPEVIPFYGSGRYIRAYWRDKEYLP